MKLLQLNATRARLRWLDWRVVVNKRLKNNARLSERERIIYVPETFRAIGNVSWLLKVTKNERYALLCYWDNLGRRVAKQRFEGLPDWQKSALGNCQRRLPDSYCAELKNGEHFCYLGD